MNTLHVIQQVVVAREAIVRRCTLAFLVLTEVGAVAVAVKAVSFPLMTQEARGRGELGVVAGFTLASERPNVRVYVLAASPSAVVFSKASLTHS